MKKSFPRLAEIISRDNRFSRGRDVFLSDGASPAKAGGRRGSWRNYATLRSISVVFQSTYATASTQNACMLVNVKLRALSRAGSRLSRSASEVTRQKPLLWNLLSDSGGTISVMKWNRWLHPRNIYIYIYTHCNRSVPWILSRDRSSLRIRSDERYS